MGTDRYYGNGTIYTHILHPTFIFVKHKATNHPKQFYKMLSKKKNIQTSKTFCLLKGALYFMK